jgi:hypothetical protein
VSGSLQGVSIPHPLLVPGTSDAVGALAQRSGSSLGDADGDGTPAKKRGRPPLSRGEEDPQSKNSNVQEKNRQAQARFRQRQKVWPLAWLGDARHGRPSTL